MTKDRLKKLARLATGAAVVSMGPLQVLGACTPSNVTSAPTDGPHINSPPAPTTSDTPTGAGQLAEAGITLHPGVNAPMNVPDVADAAAAPPAAASGSSPRPHANALPQ